MVVRGGWIGADERHVELVVCHSRVKIFVASTRKVKVIEEKIYREKTDTEERIRYNLLQSYREHLRQKQGQ